MRKMGLAMMAAMVLAVHAGAGVYSGGSGTAGDPYKISTVADWQELIATSTDWGSSFILTADLDFAGATITPVAPDMTPGNMDFDGTAFAGVLDGAGHTLSNLKIDQPNSECVGLFGCVKAGQIQDLGMVNAIIKGYLIVGGMVGKNVQGTLTSCFATGSVTGSGGTVGGLAGYSYSGTLTFCYATGSVTGTGSEFGGLVGSSRNSTISSCYATGTVTGSWHFVGGLVGRNIAGTITSCCATGTVTGGGNDVGGLVGFSVGTLISCYATGTVTGSNQSVGGLVGFNEGTLISCYATGAVSGTNEIGGLVGHNSGDTPSGCFWDIRTSWTTASAGGTGKTTTEMKRQATFTDAGWDFENVWMIVENQSYPTLRGISQPGWGSADLNGDGKVDLSDFALFAEQWMK